MSHVSWDSQCVDTARCRNNVDLVLEANDLYRYYQNVCTPGRLSSSITIYITCRSFSGRSLSMPLFVLHSLGYSLTLSVRDVPYFILITIERLYQFRTFWSYFFRITFLFTPCFFSSLLSLYLYFLSGVSFVSFLSFYYEMKSDFDFSILNQMYLKYTFEWFISK